MYVIKKEFIIKSLQVLRDLGVHRSTLGYLCVRRCAAIEGKSSDLKVDFKAFFDRYFKVDDTPVNKPYIVPFESSDAKLFYNSNVAGSFSPSSVRPENPFRTAIQINGQGQKTTYTLKVNHSLEAFNNLLYSNRIPIVEFAAFLYRDFAFDSQNIDEKNLVFEFQNEFGYVRNGQVISEFDEIFFYSKNTNIDSIFETFNNL